MKHLLFTALAVAATLSAAQVCAQEGTSRNAQLQANGVATPAVEHPKVTAYTLPPDLYKKARDRSRIQFRLDLVGFLYGLVVLWIILHWKISSAYRNWAEAYSARQFFQAIIYVPLILLTIAILTLPLDIYGETI